MVSLLALAILLAQVVPAGTGTVSGRILGANGEPAVNTRVAAVLVSQDSVPLGAHFS